MYIRSSIVFVVVATAVSATVLPANGVDWTAHPYEAPGPDDARGPCPGLNALANHGFLPRDGKNISIPMILEAGFDAYHMDNLLLAPPAKLGLYTSPADHPTTFTLEDIKAHGVIEADASLSRQDFAMGDNYHFNETIFSTLANSNPGSDVYNITSTAEVMRLRLEDSLKNNPDVTNTDTTHLMQAGASAFFLSVMGDPLTGVAPKNFVKIFFREERLPVQEGWKRSDVTITTDTVGALIQKLFAAYPTWEPTGKNCLGIAFPVST